VEALPPVQDSPQRNRFEMRFNSAIAYIDYRRANGVLTLLFASVPSHLSGRGVGSALVRGALELVAAEPAKVIPVCSFVAHFIRRHPEFQHLQSRSA
jgi:predicted GNAT family acetyltransferase